jgi:hypothetical protein
VTAIVLGVDALIRMYWLTGRTWPARDAHALSQAVPNADVPFTPRVLVPLIVVLTVGATAVLAKAGLLGGWLPDGLSGWIPTTATAASLSERSFAAAPASSGHRASAPDPIPPSIG